MMNSDLANQLTKGITNCICFSLQFDESVDVVNISQPCIFVRMDFQDMNIKEELLTILPLKKKTRGQDVYSWGTINDRHSQQIFGYMYERR
ncbi:hypothetical protein TNCV_4199741 [Trichonephila clavipes]|uniref:Uncharacterized protein n=1 Tax=Trichonephila clavipes TaxID=2585209 RepID=A0A8X6WB71_TRICX|nr:hypothetical protein TNCV_4199741 [Trichonephila clavipes]